MRQNGNQCVVTEERSQSARVGLAAAVLHRLVWSPEGDPGPKLHDQGWDPSRARWPDAARAVKGRLPGPEHPRARSMSDDGERRRCFERMTQLVAET